MGLDCRVLVHIRGEIVGSGRAERHNARQLMQKH
jgi:hypothetical protein